MDVLLTEAIVAAHPEGGHVALPDQSIDGHPGYAQEVSDLVHGQQPSLGERFSSQGAGIVREDPRRAIPPSGPRGTVIRPGGTAPPPPGSRASNRRRSRC